MKAAREWTAEQKNALEARNTSLVVSAAAGSGKTSVLTERIVGLLSDEKNPVRASRLVVVTFTSNAAREISGRLYDALSDAISHGEGAAHLSSQLLALSRAHISTVHSFCFSLIRDYRKVLGLPEKLRVGEDTETAEMKEEAAAAAVEAFLKGEGGQSPARRETLFRLFGDSKKSTALTETILRAMEQLSSYPSGSEGLAEGVEKLREESLALSKGSYRFGETGLGRVVAEKLEEKFQTAAELLETVGKTCRPTEKKGEKTVADLFFRAGELRRMALMARMGNFSDAKEALDALFAISRPGVTTLSKEEQSLCKTVYDKEVKGELKDFFKKYVSPDVEEDGAETEEMLEILEDFLSLLLDTERRYGEEKREKGILDFSDLEHLTLRLVGEKKDGVWQQSSLGKALSEEFDAIFVDEYQDTNEIQDCIFRFVSKENNLFIVGDPKQSIYRFRGAEPSVFTEYTKKTPSYQKGNGGMQKILLSANFRCDQSVVDFVNLIFRGMMCAEKEESLYRPEDELIHRKKKKDGEASFLSELVFVEKKPTEEKIDPEGTESGEPEEETVFAEEKEEISYLCHRVEAVLGEEKEEGKLFCPDDIAVICELNRQVDTVQKALSLRKIPVAVASKEEKNKCPEALFVRALLGALDNPADDVCLLGTLSSPVFGYSPDELYQIRKGGRKISFFAAMKRLAASESETLAPKIRETLEILEELRLLAQRIPLGAFCYRLYRRLSIAELYASSGDAPWKDDFLRAAMEAEGQGPDTLGEFCRFLDRRKEKASMEGTGVRVINIHQSKGLEFPVVFVPFLGKSVSSRDEEPTLLIHKGKTAATPVLRLGGAAKKNGAYRKAVALHLREENRQELMRRYYVAFTRAKQRLILTAQSPGREKLKAKILFGAEDFPVSLRSKLILEAGNVLTMVLHSLRDTKPLRDYLETGEAASDGTFSVSAVLPPPFTVWEGKTAKKEEEVFPLAECRPNFEFHYERAERQNLPQKLSVSELLRQGREEEAEFSFRSLRADKWNAPESDAARIGTATHKVMQFIDFAEAYESVEKALLTLQEKKFLSDEEFSLVEKEKITSFFASSLANRMQTSPAVVHEKRFNVLLPAMPLLQKEGEVLIQGVVDAWFENPDGTLTLLDFKTDRVKEADGEEILRLRHGEQLRLYRLAVEELTGKTVSELLIYSFALGKEIKI